MPSVLDNIQSINSCRSSGSKNLIDILDFGRQPLANAFKERIDDDESCFPLTLSFCPDSSLLQIRQTVPKELLFSNYRWTTGGPPATQTYLRRFVRMTLKLKPIERRDLILEIASNDGSLLAEFKRQGFSNVLGVDPAENLSLIARQNGIPTETAFWDDNMADKTLRRFGNPKILIARNVIPHVDQVNVVMKAIAMVLDKHGVGVIEFHDANRMLKELHYDSVYHEHLSYFSLSSMRDLLTRHGLYPFHVIQSPVSGGSLVVYFSKHPVRRSPEFITCLNSEGHSGVREKMAWIHFAQRCQEHKARSHECLAEFMNGSVVGYGASARSSTYLNFCGFDSRHLRSIIDMNPLKIGRFTPGSSIPIVSVDDGLRLKPDLIFILAWNFKDDIIRECRMRGYEGGFLTTFPYGPQIVEINT